MEDIMNMINHETRGNNEEIAAARANEIQEQVKQSLKELSLERLQVVADFVAYIADKESEEATQELLEIPGLLERIKKNRETTSKTDVVNWRAIRSDV